MIRKYMIYSTIFSVFASDNLFYRTDFDQIDIRLYYFIIALNSSFLIVAKKFKVSSKLILLLTIIGISGFVGFIRHPAILQRYLMSLWGISFVSLYLYAFYNYAKCSYVTLFEKYLKGCIWITICGFLEVLYTYFSSREFIRFDSFTTEASVYSTLVLPAFFFYLKTSFDKRKISWSFLLITGGLLLSQSSLAFIGIAISIIFLKNRYSLSEFYTIGPIVFIINMFFYQLYHNNEMFSSRADSIFLIKENKDDLAQISGLNASSFYLAANFFVAIESVKETYGMGNGLGSHANTYKRKFSHVLGVDNLGEDFMTVAYDGSSLFNRILSDLGIWGLCLVIYFLYHYRISQKGIYQVISRAILVTLICRLVRDGRYFNTDLIFFIMGYIWLFFEQKQKIEKEKSSN